VFKPALRKEAQITLSSLRKRQFDLGLWGVVLWRWAAGAAAEPRRDQRRCCERSSKQACTNDARVCWSCVRTYAGQRTAPAGSDWAATEAGKARIRPQRGVCRAIERAARARPFLGSWRGTDYNRQGLHSAAWGWPPRDRSSSAGALGRAWQGQGRGHMTPTPRWWVGPLLRRLHLPKLTPPRMEWKSTSAPSTKASAWSATREQAGPQ
jgi:hypothetical protein